MQFFRTHTMEGGVQIEIDLDSAHLLYEAVDSLAVTDKRYLPLDGLARSLRHTLAKKD